MPRSCSKFSNLTDDRQEKRIAQARAHFPEIQRKDLEPVGDRLVADKGSGLLFAPAMRLVDVGSREDAERVRAFTIDVDGSVVFLERPSGAATVAELEAEKATAAAAEQQAHEEHAKWLKSQPMRPVTVKEIEHDDSLPTLQSAARTILNSGGRFRVADGHLVIELPERVSPAGPAERSARAPLLRAARICYLGADLIMAELARPGRKQLDPGQLPDADVTPSGAIAP